MLLPAVLGLSWAAAAGESPSITRLAPVGVVAGGADFTLVIQGRNFTKASVARWNGAALETSCISETILTAKIPARLISSAGKIPITVSTEGADAPSVEFTISEPPAEVTSKRDAPPAGSEPYAKEEAPERSASLPPASPINPAQPPSAAASDPSISVTTEANLSSDPTSISASAGILVSSGSLSSTNITPTAVSNSATSVSTSAKKNTTNAVSPSFSLPVGPPPTLTSMTPTSVLAGGSDLTLTVIGTNFTLTSIVMWGTTALTTIYQSATQLTATIPAALSAAAGTASVSISDLSGTSSALTFTILQPPPAISSLSPSSAVTGSAAFTLTINGSFFTTASVALWNTTKLTTTYLSSTQLTAAVPASLLTSIATPNITVTTKAGVSSGVPFAVNPPAPTITALSPTTTRAFGNAFTLTISGTNFTSTSVVNFSGNQITSTTTSATKITATVPAALIASVGVASVTVTNVTGTSPAASFTIIQPPPTISSLSPTSTVAGGADLLLTINGTNFDATSVASFSSSALVTTVLSATQLTAVIPAALTANYGSGIVTVTTDGGTSSSATFTIIPQPPVITSLNPSQVITGSGAFTLTITGTNFNAGSIAMWNTTTLVTTYLSPTQLTAAVPASFINNFFGTLNISVKTTGGVSSGVPFAVNPPAPTITNLSPSMAWAYGNAFTLTLSGTNFTSTSIVSFGAIQLASTTVNASKITTTVPAALIAIVGVASVTVTNVTGTSPAASFTIIQPPPTLASLSPTSTVAGGADLLLTINGTNFDATSVASFASTALVTTVLSTTQLTAVIPAALTANYGSGIVTVSTDGGATSGATFTIIPQTPAITSLNPSLVITGSGAFTLTITGTNFTTASIAMWNTTRLSTTYLSSTQLTAAVPASYITSAGTPNITVSTTGGVSLAVPLIVNPPTPTITALSPATALAFGNAFTLAISGTNFTSTSILMWNGNALPVTYKSATQLTATVPAALIASVGVASVTVTNVTGTSPAASFTIIQPPPTLASLNPTSTVAGGADLLLTINGTNFDATSVASFASTVLVTTVLSTTQLTAVLPAALTANYGSGSVTVTTDGGTSSGATFTIIPQPPVITSLNPSLVITGSGAFTLTITGTNFNAGSIAMWNTTTLVTTYLSPTQLTAAVPASFINTFSGTLNISVKTTGGVSAGLPFAVNPPAPTITNLSPSTAWAYGNAFTLTLSGTNFTSTSIVSFGAIQLASTTVNATKITATVPAALIANVGVASVTVTNVTGTSPAASFTIIQPPPTLASLNPTSTVAGGADLLLTINGTNFDATSVASFASTALATTVLSTTQLTAVIPAALTANFGTGSVTVTTDGGTTSGATFTIIPQPPTLTSLNPAIAIAGNPAFTLTITGTNFVPTATALWNTTTLVTTYLSSTQITAAVPANLFTAIGTAGITVNTSGGVTPVSTITINPPAPTINNLKPSYVIAGGSDLPLTLNGANFTSTSTISFGGTQLTATFVSAAQMTTTVPAALTANVGAVTLTATNVTGTSTPANFNINPPPPAISSLSPSFTAAGGAAFTLAITGVNFTATTTSSWGTTALATTYVSPTQLTVAVPASLIATTGTPSITVTNVSGTSPGATFTINPPPPTITSLSLTNIVAGSAAFTLTVNGTNFASTSTLNWNGSALPFTYKSATQLSVPISAALIASTGTAAINVTNISGTSPAVTFTISQPPPTISSLSPTSTVAGGASLLLTINGTNFDSTSVAYLGSTALATTIVSTIQLTATIPAALTANYGSSSITVGTDGGVSTGLTFTILPQPPTIASLSPALIVSGSAAFTLTVTGSNFTTTSKVLWNSSALTTDYVSATQVTAYVPASLITAVGTPAVTISTAGGVSPAATFNINPPAPTLTSLSPATAVAGNPGYTLTINGSNFTATSTALWNTTALAVTYISSKQITAAIPASLFTSIGTAGIKVTNVTGTTSAATITILPPQPVITSITPDSVLMNNGAFTMAITGANFQPGLAATAVKWNNNTLATTYISSTQLTAAVPANLLPYGSNPVYVITAGGTSVGFPLTVVPPVPTITTSSMTGVPAGYNSFTMSVYGTYFTSSMVLNWGSTPLTGTLVGSFTYTFTVPANLVATPGPVSLTVTTIGGTSAPITFTVTQLVPAITSISPATIPAGSASFTLTVNGANFFKGMNTKFGSTWVGANLINSKQLTVTVPATLVATAGATSVELYVPGAGYSNSVPFTTAPAPPVLATISPTSATAGAEGFNLTVTGTALTTTTTVMWGATPLTTNYVSPTQIQALVPASLLAAAGSVNIWVVSAAGTSTSSTFTINQAPPQICGLNPSMALAGEGAFTLTIYGNYFTPTSTSMWGSIPLATTYISSTQLTAFVPAKLIASAGSSSITVTTAIGTSPSAIFAILAGTAPPSITTSTMPAGTVGLAYTGPIQVTGGVPGYSWTTTGLPSNFTYFRTSGSTLVITGTPAEAGPITFQVSARDTANNIAGPITLTINVNPGPNAANNASLLGSYTCLLQGSIDDDGTRWASILSFQADGQGDFNNGIFDTNSYDIGSASGIVSGAYSIGSDNNGTASIHTILTNGAAGVQTTQWAIALSGSAQPAAEFRMVEADDLGTSPSYQQGTAECYLANPSAFAATSVDGLSFAFAMDGEDNSSNVKTTAGQFTASSGAIQSGYLDTTLGGSAADQPTAFTGTYTEPDPVWGRFTLSLNGAGASTGYTIYVIDANRMFILDNTNDDGEQAGNLRLQQPAAATAAALNGPFVLYNRGAQFNSNSGIPTSFYANLLLGSGDGAGNLTINQSYSNAAGVYQAGQFTGGPTPLAFDPNNPGRASFVTAAGTTYLYFYDANKAFEMTVGNNGSVDSGRLEAQSAAQLQNAFTGAALQGSYLFGERPLLSLQPTAYLGEYTLSSSGAITAGVTTSSKAILSWDQSFSPTYAWDSTVTASGGFFIHNGAQGAASCAPISATQFACIPQTDPAPSVQIMQQ